MHGLHYATYIHSLHLLRACYIYTLHLLHACYNIHYECVQFSRNRVQTSCDSVSDFLKIFESIADLQALRVVGVLGE